MNPGKVCLSLAVVLALPLLHDAAAAPAAGRLLSVGPNRALTRPSQAAAIAADGDVIEIDAGLYSGDVCTWVAPNLTIRAIGGRARIDAAGKSSQGKAIWVIAGANTTIENVEFFGCRVADRNGAGIRQEGPGLTVRNSYFHNNEMGILTSSHSASDILLESCEFAYNGFGDGYSHNMYINQVRSFTLRSSYTHHANYGHLVKSRALKNVLEYNRITGEGGTEVYCTDFPNGGETLLVGNLIQQSPNSANRGIVTYAAEGAVNPVQQFTAVNNTLVNDAGSGVFINLYGAPAARVQNNLFVGPGTTISGNAQMATNVVTVAPGFANKAAYDYRLLAGSPAIDAGSVVSPAPTRQYVHPISSEVRPVVGALDAGAYEFGSGGTPPPAETGTGLTGRYYDNRDFTALRVTRIDPTVNFSWGSGAPAAGMGVDTFSVRWTGSIQAPVSGTYTFFTVSDDGIRLWVNGQQIVNNWTLHGPTENSGAIALVAGQKVALRLDYFEKTGGATAQLLWSGPGISKQVVPQSRLFPQ
jgi:hypothetical protein